MGLQIIGNGGTVLDVEAAYKSARTTQYPVDPLTLGAYSLAIDNGTTVMSAGLASNSPIWSFRWGSSNLAIVRSVRLCVSSITAFAAGRFAFDLFFARSFTASDTGGTTATISGNNAKKRTNMGTTLLTECRFSQTATLTAGTRTLDTQPIGKLIGNAIMPTSPMQFFNPFGTLWERNTSDEYPLVLAQNEGLVLQATVPGTGTWFFSVTIEWLEAASF